MASSPQGYPVSADPMQTATPSVQDLARLLLAVEAKSMGETTPDSPSEHAEREAYAAVNILDILRSHLSRLVGVAQCQALLGRALALAKREADWLEAVRVQPDATLEGFSEAARQQPAEAVTEGSVALLAQILRLLITFIGGALTLCLVVNVWPEAQSDNLHLGTEELPA